MVITSVSLFIYGIGTVTSLAMTYIEGARRDRDWDLYRVTGIILCFSGRFWCRFSFSRLCFRHSVSRNDA